MFNDSEAVLEDIKFVDTFAGAGTSSETIVKKRKNHGVKHKFTCNDEEELSQRRKVQEAAVSPEWILNGESTKGWSEPKGKVFMYSKNKNGVLELQDSFS